MLWVTGVHRLLERSGTHHGDEDFGGVARAVVRSGHAVEAQHFDERQFRRPLRLEGDEFRAGDGLEIDHDLVVGFGQRDPARNAMPLGKGAGGGEARRGPPRRAGS